MGAFAKRIRKKPVKKLEKTIKAIEENFSTYNERAIKDSLINFISNYAINHKYRENHNGLLEYFTYGRKETMDKISLVNQVFLDEVKNLQYKLN